MTFTDNSNNFDKNIGMVRDFVLERTTSSDSLVGIGWCQGDMLILVIGEDHILSKW